MDRIAIGAVFIVGAICQYLGAALGVSLFDILDPAAVAWLRGAAAGVILLAAVALRRGWSGTALRRGWSGTAPRRGWSGARIRRATMFGVVTLAMNIAFYEAIARIDLGTAVAIEFLGPIAVACAGSRRLGDLVAAVLALAGVICVAGVSLSGVHGAAGLIGVACALAAAALWSGYIVLGKRVAEQGGGIAGLGVGLALGSVVLAPIAVGPDLYRDAAAFARPEVWLLGLGVGVLSSVIPYALDQVVLARIARTTFALLLALLPVTAAAVGAAALGQRPQTIEILGIALVMVAIVATSRADARAYRQAGNSPAGEPAP